MDVVNLAEKFSRVAECWSPRVVAQLNGQEVKIARLRGEFLWHHHPGEDEMFLVVRGRLRMKYRDAAGAEQEARIGEGEFVVVPRGTEHLPIADEECHVLLFEPAGTRNTGNVLNERTVAEPERI